MAKSDQLLNEIIKRFRQKGFAQVRGYNAFEYIRETPKSIYVSRENGQDTPVSHKRLLMGIEAYLANPANYDEGPTMLRQYGITHVTSPVYALLHLLDKKDYC